MATGPEHIEDMTQTRTRAGRPPITASRAFPWIGALWLAALLGVGSLIVPVALLERASVASGLASVVPAAAPPLGSTAQALVALVGTLVGALLGLVLARRIAAAKRPALTEEAGSAISEESDVPEDIETETQGEFLEPRSRRRALAVEPAEAPRCLDLAPLPGTTGMEKPVPQIRYSDPGGEPEGGESESVSKDFTALAEALEPVLERDEAATELHGLATSEDPLPFSPPSMSRREEDEPGQHDHPVAFPANDAGQESEDTVSDNPHFETPTTDTDEPLEAPLDPDQPATEAETDAPARRESDDGAEEGLVQLVQRLGATLERHRKWSAEQAALKAAACEPSTTADAGSDAEDNGGKAAPVSGEFGLAAPEDAAEAMAAYFGSSASTADSATGDTGEAETQRTSSLFETFVGLAGNEEEEDGEEVDESAEFGDFASLNPFRRDTAQVVDIGEAENMARRRPSNDDNERVLREALMNLQRMGK